jgi:hypothetical protein
LSFAFVAGMGIPIVRLFVGRVVRLIILLFVFGDLLFVAAPGVSAQSTTPAQNTKPEPKDVLAKQIKELAEKLGALPTDSTEVQNALGDLAKAIAIRTNGCDIKPAIDTCLARLTDAIFQLNAATTALMQKSPSVKLSDDQVSQVEAQVAALADVVAISNAATPATPTGSPPTTPLDPTATATELATVLAAKFKDKPPKGADVTNKDLVKALQALPVTGKASAAPATPVAVINVVGAYFGDLADVTAAVQTGWLRIVDDGRLITVPRPNPLHDPRWCSATRTVRTLCQGQQTCLQTPIGTTSDKALSSHIIGTEMCGFDPVPYAEAKTKGLAVFFECLTTDPSSDAALYSDQPVAFNQGPPPRAAYLRVGESAGFSCSSAALNSASNKGGGQGSSQSTSPSGAATVTVITGGQNTISTGAATPSTSTSAAANQSAATGATPAAAAATPTASGTTPTTGGAAATTGSGQ